jgi:hypothetical protein
LNQAALHGQSKLAHAYLVVCVFLCFP